MLRFSALCEPNEKKFGTLLNWLKVISPHKVLTNLSTESWEMQHLKRKKYKLKFKGRTLQIHVVDKIPKKSILNLSSVYIPNCKQSSSSSRGKDGGGGDSSSGYGNYGDYEEEAVRTTTWLRRCQVLGNRASFSLKGCVRDWKWTSHNLLKVDITQPSREKFAWQSGVTHYSLRT